MSAEEKIKQTLQDIAKNREEWFEKKQAIEQNRDLTPDAQIRALRDGLSAAQQRHGELKGLFNETLNAERERLRKMAMRAPFGKNVDENSYRETILQVAGKEDEELATLMDRAVQIDDQSLIRAVATEAWNTRNFGLVQRAATHDQDWWNVVDIETFGGELASQEDKIALNTRLTGPTA